MEQAMSDKPIDTLIAEYVSGDLSKPAKVLVDAHLELTPESRRFASRLEESVGYSLDMGQMEPIEHHGTMLNAIFDSENNIECDHPFSSVSSSSAAEWMPSALRDFIGMDPDNIPWKMKLPGVRVFKMDEVDGCEVSLLRIKPGFAMPVHTHEGRELTLVLQGAFSDGSGVYASGDVAIADEAVDHKPVAQAGEECICFAVTDAPVRFTGPVARIISSFLPN